MSAALPPDEIVIAGRAVGPSPAGASPGALEASPPGAGIPASPLGATAARGAAHADMTMIRKMDRIKLPS